MYKHILIPTDGSETATKAVRAGIEYAREAGARITLFTAVPEYRLPSEAELMSRQAISLDEHARRSKEAADAALAAAVESARAAGVDFDTDFAQKDQPYQAIIEAARRLGCDAIFMASHGRKGIDKLLHGSETIDVLTHSDIPTLVVR
jgi:nucleotide-binding universal stress UspA family protein